MSLLPGRWSVLLPIILILLSQPLHAAEGDPPYEPTAEELVARRLLLTLKQGPNDPYWPDIVAAVVRARTTHPAPADNAALVAKIGNAVTAERLLAGVIPPRLHEELRTRPNTLRGRLDREMVITYPTSADAETAKQRLLADPDVESVTTDFLVEFSVTPNDHFFSPPEPDPFDLNPQLDPKTFQWGPALLNLPQAWERQRGHAYLADPDSGIYYADQANGLVHPDLQQSFRRQFSGDANARPAIWTADPVAQSTHGTHVAGILAATPNNTVGVAGTCWNCSLSSVVVSGGTYMQWSNIATAIHYATLHGQQVINLSLGQLPSEFGQFDEYSSNQYEVQQALAHGVVLVASAGNDRRGQVDFPASAPGVIGVGGLQYDAAGPRYWAEGYGTVESDCNVLATGKECGSNYGTGLALMAPAKDIVSTVVPGDGYPNFPCGDNAGPPGDNDGYGTCTGTSMSAPFVAGIAGLIRSTDPLASPEQVLKYLKAGGKACVGPYSERCGDAVVPDARAAVDAAFGHPRAVNRLTPLFGFYSDEAKDHFYTTVPQMATAALTFGGLLPQPALDYSISYQTIGQPVPGYTSFPHPDDEFSPYCAICVPPLAIALVFTTHLNPQPGGAELLPLYRYSRACQANDGGTPCTSNPRHISHVYITAEDDRANYGYLGYRLDGIEGYVYPPTLPRPQAGAVKLCRRYSSSRNDYVLFTVAADAECSSAGEDFEGGKYTTLNWWLGWVMPVTRPRAVCPGGKPCTINLVPTLMLLDDF